MSERGIFEKSAESIKALGSALTIEGLSITSLHDFVEWVEVTNPFKNRADKEVHIISGEVMNREFGLKGDNRYPNDLTIVSIKLEDLEGDISALALRRLSIGARWLDDIIDDNERRNNNK